MKQLFFILGLINLGNLASAQVGINTDRPLATLDILPTKTDGSTAEGLIPPRLTGTQIKSADDQYLQEQKGTIVYATTAVSQATTKTVNITSAGLYYFDGNIWQKLANPTTYMHNRGDVKHSFQINDHNGWYIMNGRQIVNLPSAAQNSAIALGFTDNIPDARDRVLKTRSVSENLAELGGTNDLTITRNNLPNIQLTGTITGTTSNGGSHTHTAPEGGYILGGTQLGNNGTGNIQGNGTYPGAWSGLGRSNTTAEAGNHVHTVSGTATVNTGGQGTILDNRSPYITVNTFIYLGQ